jgi:hypothetical protein
LAYGEQKTSCLSLSWPLAIHHIQSLHQEVEIIVFCVEKSSYQETKGSKTRVKTCMTFAREKKAAKVYISVYTHSHTIFTGWKNFCSKTKHALLSSPFSSHTRRVNSNFHFTTRLNQVSPAITLSIHSHSICFFFCTLGAREI